MPVIIHDQQEGSGNCNPHETWLSSTGSWAGGKERLEGILIEREIRRCTLPSGTSNISLQYFVFPLTEKWKISLANHFWKKWETQSSTYGETLWFQQSTFHVHVWSCQTHASFTIKYFIWPLVFLFSSFPRDWAAEGMLHDREGMFCLSHTFYLLQSVVYNEGSYTTCPGEYLPNLKYHS